MGGTGRDGRGFANMRRRAPRPAPDRGRAFFHERPCECTRSLILSAQGLSWNKEVPPPKPSKTSSQTEQNLQNRAQPSKTEQKNIFLLQVEGAPSYEILTKSLEIGPLKSNGITAAPEIKTIQGSSGPGGPKHENSGRGSGAVFPDTTKVQKPDFFVHCRIFRWFLHKRVA